MSTEPVRQLATLTGTTVLVRARSLHPGNWQMLQASAFAPESWLVTLSSADGDVPRKKRALRARCQLPEATGRPRGKAGGTDCGFRQSGAQSQLTELS